MEYTTLKAKRTTFDVDLVSTFAKRMFLCNVIKIKISGEKFECSDNPTIACIRKHIERIS